MELPSMLDCSELELSALKESRTDEQQQTVTVTHESIASGMMWTFICSVSRAFLIKPRDWL